MDAELIGREAIVERRLVVGEQKPCSAATSSRAPRGRGASPQRPRSAARSARCAGTSDRSGSGCVSRCVPGGSSWTNVPSSRFCATKARSRSATRRLNGLCRSGAIARQHLGGRCSRARRARGRRRASRATSRVGSGGSLGAAIQHADDQTRARSRASHVPPASRSRPPTMRGSLASSVGPLAGRA